MKSAFAIVYILAALTTAYSRDVKTNDFTSSDFCVPPDFGQGLECPPFKLVANTSKYQLREYDAGKHLPALLVLPNLFPSGAPASS